MSIHDICKIVKGSKPSIYREFGSDDGLKAAALQVYKSKAIDLFLSLFKLEQPLARTLDDVVAFLIEDRVASGIPKGCLFVTMRGQRDRLGAQTIKLLDQLRADFLDDLTCWVNATKNAGEFSSAIPTKTAAHHIDALHAGAMRMQYENVPTSEIKNFLETGLVAISSSDLVMLPPPKHNVDS